MSSPPWPTSMATATTSAPVCSAIQPMATEVSRPPEYARTTRPSQYSFPHPLQVSVSQGLRRRGWPRRSSSALGQGEQLRGEVGAARRVPRDHQHRVVAGHGAEDGRPGRRARSPRRGTGPRRPGCAGPRCRRWPRPRSAAPRPPAPAAGRRGAVPAAGPPRFAARGIRGAPAPAGPAIQRAPLGRPSWAGRGGSGPAGSPGSAYTAASRRRRGPGRAPVRPGHGAWPGDGLPRSFSRRASSLRRDLAVREWPRPTPAGTPVLGLVTMITLAKQPGQQCLLRVEPVLGLIRDGVVRARPGPRRDLLAAVRGQAMQHEASAVPARSNLPLPD